ncbi:hypothetical protein [Streptomyces collinus]|uniref:Uncharacterized protein n=1 Tax=Streptomyces collinus (strain DSM 40733 / Tue 365) TaxID=1214242 RepID=S5V0H6_STRC3|nr:hypothetical protein [Streptomyces collinus]AGS68704.1 hypothetical protein B446_09405 [Streptomyces collinus Tu 365]
MTMGQDVSTLLALPGVRGQIEAIAADLEAGLNCLWLLPDHLVETGDAEDLYRAALHTAPDRLDVQPPTVLPIPTPRGPDTGEPSDRSVAHHAAPWEEEAWDGLPDLDFDGGYDIGWETPAPARATTAPVREHPVPALFERLGKELAVSPGEVVARLTDRRGRWRPVIGLRAWREPEDSGQPAPGGPPGGGRGGAVERLLRSLTAAVKDAGLPPHERPRLLVVSRLRDVPEALTDELDRDIATAAVHWWWGTVGRLDTALAVAAAKRSAPGATLEQRIVAAVRDEVITELAAFDLLLAQRLTDAWDGTASRLDAALRSCLDVALIARAGACPGATQDAGSRRRPASRLRSAWSEGVVQSWDGMLRRHPAGWYATGGAAEHRGRPIELTTLVGQAQQRVVSPWIEETRDQLARLGVRYATKALDTVVATYSQRPPAGFRDRPEEAFRQLEVGTLLAAQYAGALAFPAEEEALLKDLVRVRNILAHRGALRDDTLAAFCTALIRAHRRWAKL